jgi:hypothetical protein
MVSGRPDQLGIYNDCHWPACGRLQSLQGRVGGGEQVVWSLRGAGIEGTWITGG